MYRIVSRGKDDDNLKRITLKYNLVEGENGTLFQSGSNIPPQKHMHNLVRVKVEILNDEKFKITYTFG
jgi:glycogen synthase